MTQDLEPDDDRGRSFITFLQQNTDLFETSRNSCLA